MENDAAHPSEEKKDVEKPKDAGKEATHALKEKTDAQNTKGTEKDAVHPRGGEKDVKKSTSVENDAVNPNDGRKDVRNSEKAGNVEYMTVIFHALLTPTFNISFRQGDKVVLRGDPPFSWSASNHVMQDVRYSSFSPFTLFSIRFLTVLKYLIKRSQEIIYIIQSC